MMNIVIKSELDAWLAFLSTDEPEIVAELYKSHPEFRSMYEDIYELCQNMERVMEMFSKELIELDRNTVQYMIDEMQDTIDKQKNQLVEKEGELAEKEGKLAEKEGELAEKEGELVEKKSELAEKDRLLNQYEDMIEKLLEENTRLKKQ